jgi:[ribosomal protein S18]-alanine N-acetyltransferase
VSAPPHPAAPVDPATLSVVLTPMRRRHLRSVLRIESHNPHRPWSLGLFMSELALRHSRTYVVARVDGSVVGFGGVMFTGVDAHVTTIAVDPAFRSAFVGTRMMSVLAARAVALGCEAMTLEVRTTNEPAHALYRKFGFEVAGVRKNYYSDLGEDAAVMWATEIQSSAYRDRLTAIEASVPGRTVMEGWSR